MLRLGLGLGLELGLGLGLGLGLRLGLGLGLGLGTISSALFSFYRAKSIPNSVKNSPTSIVTSNKNL